MTLDEFLNDIAGGVKVFEARSTADPAVRSVRENETDAPQAGQVSIGIGKTADAFFSRQRQQNILRLGHQPTVAEFLAQIGQIGCEQRFAPADIGEAFGRKAAEVDLLDEEGDEEEEPPSPLHQDLELIIAQTPILPQHRIGVAAQGTAIALITDADLDDLGTALQAPSKPGVQPVRAFPVARPARGEQEMDALGQVLLTREKVEDLEPIIGSVEFVQPVDHGQHGAVIGEGAAACLGDRGD